MSADRSSTLLRLPLLGERGIIIVLCYTYFLSCIDRGIVPGAPESFQSFTTKSIGVPVTEQSVYFGLLSSAYIASRAVFAIVFGSLALRIRPFQLIAIGMSAWVVSIVISGVAYYVNSYYLLVVGRALSGMGGATINCNGLPFVNKHAPQKNRTLWLGGMIASAVIGLSAGYPYGSAFASSSLGWAWSFFVEALLMVPALVCFMWCIPDSLNVVPSDTMTKNQDLVEPLIETSIVRQQEGDDLNGAKPTESAHGERTGRAKQTWRDWVNQFKNVPFVLVVFGFTCYTVAITAITVFSPILVISMGFYKDEAAASFTFGVMMLTCGTVGTLGGAMVLDRMTKGQQEVTSKHRRKLAIDLLFSLMSVGAVVGLVSLLFTDTKMWFLVLLGIALTFMSGIGPAQNVAVMESFPESQQAMAVATSTVVMLLLGQVPTPLVIGWLKDAWSPLCGTVVIDKVAQLNPACSQDRSGLTDVLLFSFLWLPAAALAWGIAKFIVSRSSKSTTSQLV